MRVAVLGAAGAALLGATLAITPLDTVGAPVRAPGACGNGAGASCERLASVLAPQAGPAGQAAAVPALAAPVSIAPAPALAAGPSDALPAPHPVAAQVIAPGLAPRPGVPSAAVPGLGVPGVPGQTTVPGLGVPGVGVPGIPGLPGTDISGYDLPGLLNQAYALVNGVVGADVAAATVGPITSGVLGAAGIVAGVGGSGLNALITLAYLNRLNGSGIGSDLAGAAKLVSMLAPIVGTAQLPAVNLPALAANLRALPGFAATALPGVALPPPPSIPTLVAGLRALPPPQLPPLPPPPQLPSPPVLCGPWIGFFRPCI
jgi:hypothetical protein